MVTMAYMNFDHSMTVMFFPFELEFVMRFAIKAVSSVLISLVMSGAVFAQNFPNKTVTLMVPYPAGGVSDVIARTLNNTLAKHLGQTVIVENLGGASGGIAGQKVLNSPADGHMIFQGSPNELILAPLSNAAIKYKPEDFRLVQMITINPLVVSEVASDPTVKSALEAHAMIVPRPQALTALSKLYSDNTARYRAMAKSMGLKAQ